MSRLHAALWAIVIALLSANRAVSWTRKDTGCEAANRFAEEQMWVNEQTRQWLLQGARPLTPYGTHGVTQVPQPYSLSLL